MVKRKGNAKTHNIRANENLICICKSTYEYVFIEFYVIFINLNVEKNKAKLKFARIIQSYLSIYIRIL